MISSGHCVSTHGGLVIYLHEKWSYRIKNYETESQIWENQKFVILHIPIVKA